VKVFAIIRHYDQKLTVENCLAALFAQPLVLPFCSDQTVCPDCQSPLQVYKTQDRTVRLLDLGSVTAHETLLCCGRCQNSAVWVEGACQRVQGGGLPTTQLESFPLRCAYGLIQWALAGKSEGEGYGFPFDRPHVELARPLRVLGQRLEEIKTFTCAAPGKTTSRCSGSPVNSSI